MHMLQAKYLVFCTTFWESRTYFSKIVVLCENKSLIVTIYSFSLILQLLQEYKENLVRRYQKGHLFFLALNKYVQKIIHHFRDHTFAHFFLRNAEQKY